MAYIKGSCIFAVISAWFFPQYVNLFKSAEVIWKKTQITILAVSSVTDFLPPPSLTPYFQRSWYCNKNSNAITVNFFPSLPLCPTGKYNILHHKFDITYSMTFCFCIASLSRHRHCTCGSTQSLNTHSANTEKVLYFYQTLDATNNAPLFDEMSFILRVYTKHLCFLFSLVSCPVCAEMLPTGWEGDYCNADFGE